MTTYLSVLVVTALCLAIKPLRGWGVAGVGLMLLAYPYLTLTLLSIAGGTYFYFNRRLSK